MAILKVALSFSKASRAGMDGYFAACRFFGFSVCAVCLWLIVLRATMPATAAPKPNERALCFCAFLLRGYMTEAGRHIISRAASLPLCSVLTPRAYNEKNSKFLQIPSNELLQMESFERFSTMKFL